MLRRHRTGTGVYLRMKHYIISKFRPGTPWREYLPEIEEIFGRTLRIEGVHGVDVFPSCSERPNRFDLMICMDMDAAALPLYDASEPHRTWKEKFGPMLEGKTIFDHE